MPDLTLRLDEASDEPIYMQIYRYIKHEIAAGRIKTGARLPSVRTFAARLGVSRTPVSLAYDQLQAEGYAISRPRSGLFAAEIEPAPGDVAAKRTAARPIHTPPVLHRAYHAASDASARYDFGYGSIDLTHFPLKKWAKLLNACFRPENSRMLLYGDYQGEPGLRAEIAAYLHQNRGVRCSPEQIVVGAGTYHSLDLLFQLLRDEAGTIAVEGAVNDGVAALLDHYRFQAIPIGLEQDGIDLEELFRSRAKAVYVTPSHQFPLGMTLSAGKRQKLLNWAGENDAWIIENDYDGEFRYGGRPIPSLQGMDGGEGRVIYTGTFSKALTPAFRLSCLVLPRRLLERFVQRRHSYDQLASPILQTALRLFMQSGDFERHMRRMRRIYQAKHDLLLAEVRSSFGEAADVVGAGSGLHVLLRVRNGMSETRLVQTAREAGVNVYPASVYALAPEHVPASTVLLGFGGLPETDIAAGIGHLAKAWLEYPRPGLGR